MTDFKLLKLPLSEDATINMILSLDRRVLEDDTGVYADLLMVIIIDYLAQFPTDQSEDLNNSFMKMKEARMWYNSYFDDLEEEELAPLST